MSVYRLLGLCCSLAILLTRFLIPVVLLAQLRCVSVVFDIVFVICSILRSLGFVFSARLACFRHLRDHVRDCSVVNFGCAGQLLQLLLQFSLLGAWT